MTEVGIHRGYAAGIHGKLLPLLRRLRWLRRIGRRRPGVAAAASFISHSSISLESKNKGCRRARTAVGFGSLFADLANFQVFRSESLLKLQGPFPRRPTFFFCIDVDRAGECQGDGLCDVQKAANIEKYRSLTMGVWQMPEVEPGHVRLEQCRIEHHTRHVAIALKPERDIFQIRQGAKDG